MRTKICGISNVIDARAAQSAGADALGFVLGGRVQPSEIEPPAQHIRSILKQLNPHLLTVLVTHLTQVEEILALAGYLGVTGIQISEPLATPLLEWIRSQFKGKIIKTVVVAAEEESFSELRRVEPYCDSILLDSCVAGYIGGTGMVSDWLLCKKLVSAASRPVWLAGGLNPDNVAHAIRATAPSGVDVSTGVSCFSADYPRKDRKDYQKIQRFIKVSRGAGT